MNYGKFESIDTLLSRLNAVSAGLGLEYDTCDLGWRLYRNGLGIAEHEDPCDMKILLRELIAKHDVELLEKQFREIDFDSMDIEKRHLIFRRLKPLVEFYDTGIDPGLVYDFDPHWEPGALMIAILLNDSVLYSRADHMYRIPGALITMLRSYHPFKVPDATPDATPEPTPEP